MVLAFKRGEINYTFPPKIWCRFDFGPLNLKTSDLLSEILEIEQFAPFIYFFVSD